MVLFLEDWRITLQSNKTISKTVFEEKEYKDKFFSGVDLFETVYESCVFINCNFAKQSFQETGFIDCEFHECDFSMTKIFNLSIRDNIFLGCKFLGFHFEDCNQFAFSAKFENCQLNLCSFFGMDMANIEFTDCNLKEADFSSADLKGITFSNCDLQGAVFENSNLEKSDFSTAFNYSFDPVKNRINKAKFSVPGVLGLLDSFNIEII